MPASPERDEQAMRDWILEWLTGSDDGIQTMAVENDSFALIDHEEPAVWLVTVKRARFEVSDE